MAHFGVSQRVPLRNSFNPSRRQRRQTGPVVRAIQIPSNDEKWMLDEEGGS
jgi:hypothetical protein